MKRKKFIAILLCTILMPFNVLAYSTKIYPGGESIGIDIKTDGILIVGFYKINSTPKMGNSELKVGDIITKVGSKNVESIDGLASLIESEMTDNSVLITFLRNNEEHETTLNLVYENGIYKTGLYVKDSITGIGTLSYIDPETNIYGALGHEIIESNSGKKVEVKTGTIFKSYVTGIDRSVKGTPGGKNARFFYSDTYGLVTKNTDFGIYGNYTKTFDKNSTLDIATLDEVTKGPAYIYTVLDGEKKDKYEINITKIDKSNDLKNIYFEVTDERLLEKAGGIVQGMSGSPIIKDNKIIGAVTHVVVSKPSTGYGISIIKMLEEGEKK